MDKNTVSSLFFLWSQCFITQFCVILDLLQRAHTATALEGTLSLSHHTQRFLQLLLKGEWFKMDILVVRLKETQH